MPGCPLKDAPIINLALGETSTPAALKIVMGKNHVGQDCSWRRQPLGCCPLLVQTDVEDPA